MSAPVRDETERFLAALDPNTDKFTFQTFDENAERKAKRKAERERDPLAKVFNGTLNEHWNKLVNLNAKGAGIFVCVNDTDGKGREKTNIIRVRAVFTDLDGAPLDPVIAETALQPHIVTETSPERWHAYWRVDPDPPIEGEGVDAKKTMLEQFSKVQKAIAARYS